MHIKLTLRLSKGSMRKKKLKNLWSMGCYSWLISLVDLSFHLVSPKCQLKALFTSQLRVRDAQMGFRISESVCVCECACVPTCEVSLWSLSGCIPGSTPLSPLRLQSSTSRWPPSSFLGGCPFFTIFCAPVSSQELGPVIVSILFGLWCY